MFSFCNWEKVEPTTGLGKKKVLVKGHHDIRSDHKVEQLNQELVGGGVKRSGANVSGVWERKTF